MEAVMTMPTKRVMTPDEATLSLKARFAVTEDARENYSGLMVAPDDLLETETIGMVSYTNLADVRQVNIIEDEANKTQLVTTE